MERTAAKKIHCLI